MMSVYCSLVVTCCERADLLVLLCVTFPCAFVTFLYGVLGQVWYLIVLIPDLCLLSYFRVEPCVCLFDFILYLPLSQFFSYVGIGLPVLNQY